jgi:hypothetical protein
MLDSMMSQAERQRFNTRDHKACSDARARNALIAVALAFSKTLRRLWLLATFAAVALGCLVLFLEAKNVIPMDNDLVRVATLWIVFFLPIWVFWAVGLWVDSHIVRWAARKAQRDYRDGELFNR